MRAVTEIAAPSCSDEEPFRKRVACSTGVGVVATAADGKRGPTRPTRPTRTELLLGAALRALDVSVEQRGPADRRGTGQGWPAD